MADRSDISQDAQLVGADDAAASVSQDAQLVGANDAGTAISQLGATAGGDDAAAIISQFVLLVGRGPEVIPPADNPASIFVFGGGGLMVNWWIAPMVSDSGVELRDKVVKSFRVIGKMTNPTYQIYAYGPEEGIDVAALEAGTGSKTGVLALDDTTQVTQTPRQQLNVPNAMQHTCRLAGFWDGSGEPDRIDELLYEVAIQGIRR